MSHNHHNWGCECGDRDDNHHHHHHHHGCRCDSDAFDSCCSDDGQGFPLSIKVGCDLPEVPSGLVGQYGATWMGTFWMINPTTDSSTTDSS